jgi:hypothetical protein
LPDYKLSWIAGRLWNAQISSSKLGYTYGSYVSVFNLVFDTYGWREAIENCLLTGMVLKAEWSMD